jgi:hypothetical protein
MAGLNQERFQYSLAALFWVNFAAAVLMGSLRIGWWKVAAVVSFFAFLLFFVVWVSFIFDELNR